MEYILHKAENRGRAEHSWLHTRFSFSFAEWYDPDRMGFGTLRVINDDVIDPDSGFDLHPHSNMEIITIVMEGAVTHGDSMGNQEVVPAGDVQVMSAGTGVVHSERNTSLDETLKLFQIWIHPKVRNVVPRYGQKSFGVDWKPNVLRLLVSPDGREDSLSIHQDAFISKGSLEAEQTHIYMLRDARKNGVYVFVVDGSVTVNDHHLTKRDALGITGADVIAFVADQHSRYLVFEVPMAV
ncbi:MAG: pirin family protein [Candidatus Moranbacteria bacterium]|nr:pirin family protein [Candidatus Moranbacteria bacterium]